jgi:AraC-like DNA-binding protein
MASAPKKIPSTVTTRAEPPHTLFRRAAKPAYLRLRQDCQRVSERLLPLLEYLRSHLFDSDLNVNRLKLACGIRDNSIVILFHIEVGQTPKTYISGRRLETAARLLRETNLRIWQISDLVGFSTLGVFSKAFDRWAGLRPQHYRSQNAIQSSGQTPEPPEIFDGEFVERAMVGQLTPDESRRLIKRLFEIYGPSLPTFQTTLEALNPPSTDEDSANT